MEAATRRDDTRGAFLKLEDALDPAVLHRFVIGRDDGPEEMTAEEIASSLNDPFAQLLLREGNPPSTSSEVVVWSLDRADEQHLVLTSVYH